MVVRTRLRAVLIPLALYAVSASVTTYFVWHAVNGGRGLRAKDEYRVKIAQLNDKLASVLAERTLLERRVEMMRSDAVDRDLLEEEARTVLGRVRKSELVIFLPAPMKP
jgi:cell division protein FtsB